MTRLLCLLHKVPQSPSEGLILYENHVGETPGPCCIITSRTLSRICALDSFWLAASSCHDIENNPGWKKRIPTMKEQPELRSMQRTHLLNLEESGEPLLVCEATHPE